MRPSGNPIIEAFDYYAGVVGSFLFSFILACCIVAVPLYGAYRFNKRFPKSSLTTWHTPVIIVSFLLPPILVIGLIT
jgi:predicted membrane metal-binding protein